MLRTHSFLHPMHHQKENRIQNKCQFRNTKLKKKKELMRISNQI